MTSRFSRTRRFEFALRVRSELSQVESITKPLFDNIS